MRALVYRNQYGPAMALVLPAQENGVPASATIPGGPFPRAMAQIGAKGHGVTWEQWADHLAGSLPYFDSWSVEDVPDGLDPQRVLNVVRRRSVVGNIQAGGTNEGKTAPPPGPQVTER